MDLIMVRILGWADRGDGGHLKPIVQRILLCPDRLVRVHSSFKEWERGVPVCSGSRIS